MSYSESFIHVIPLGRAYLHAPHISDTLIKVIEEQKSLSKKTLIFYNRRGNARAYICEDCGYYEKCPHCDIAFSYHSDNAGALICHQCSTKKGVPLVCSHCHGNRFIFVGVGIQRIESDLARILPQDYKIRRIDSDTKERAESIFASLQEIDVILATNRALSLRHQDIGAVVFLLFEMNLSLPEYDIEETTAAEITYFKRQHIPLYIQTYMPDHPLLEEIQFGNQKSLLDYIQKERKIFLYPPFTEFATLRIHDERKERVTTLMTHLVNKIHLSVHDTTRVVHDSEVWEKVRGEWTQKIVLRDRDLSYIIDLLEVEIVRNRGVTLEWR